MTWLCCFIDIVESSANIFQGLKNVFISTLRFHYQNVMEIFSKVVHSLHIEIKLFLNSPKIMCNRVRNLRIGKYAPDIVY